MADELDSWCGNCGREVVPKRIVERYQVPTAPSMPSVSPPKKSGQRRRPLGLVHGTGRTRAALAAKPAAPQTTYETVIKERRVIDPSPLPLYCSDECKLNDLQFRNSGLPLRYDPRSDYFSPSHSSAPSRTNTDASSMSSSSSDASSDAPSEPAESREFPALNVAPAVYPTAKRVSKAEELSNRLNELHAKAPRERTTSGEVIAQPVKPQLWRPYAYGLSSPLVDESGKEILTGPYAEERANAAYMGFVPAARRSSKGVESKITPSISLEAGPMSPTFASRSPPSDTEWQGRSSDEDLMARFSSALSKRSESRLSLCSPTSPTSTAFSPSSPTYSEKDIAPASANLALPNVKLRKRNHSFGSVRSPIASSASSTRSEPCHPTDAEPLFGFARTRSRRMSPTPITAPRPSVSTVERSYSSPLIPQLQPFQEEPEELLYDAVPLPPSITKIRTTRIEKRVKTIDGVAKEVDVPVCHIIEVPVAAKTLYGPQRVLGEPLPSTSA